MDGFTLDPAATDRAALNDSFHWQLPARFNIAEACCGRWANERSRFALYVDDGRGSRQAWTFWDIQQSANRLSNVLSAMGVLPGDRVAVCLPPGAEMAISCIAVFQMGALLVPLRPAGENPVPALAALATTAARVAIVDDGGATALGHMSKDLPALKHVIGVAGAGGPGGPSRVCDWRRLLALASTRFQPRISTLESMAVLWPATASSAMLVHAHGVLPGIAPGMVCAMDFFPQRGDLLWPMSDWASPAGLLGGLLLAWGYGQPVLACAPPDDVEGILAMLEAYQVSNLLVPPETAARLSVLRAGQVTGHRLGLRNLVVVGTGAPAEQDVLTRPGVKETLGANLCDVVVTARCLALLGRTASVDASDRNGLAWAMPGHTLAVLNEHGGVCASGEEGELALRAGEAEGFDPASLIEEWSPSCVRKDVVRPRGDTWLGCGVRASCDGAGRFELR